MSNIPRPELDTVFQLADRLEASAFRWGALSADVDVNPLEWEEALSVLRATRTALRRALANLHQLGSPAALVTPITTPAKHLDCVTTTTPIPEIDWCQTCCAYVLRRSALLA